ncbi:hypothetical protein ACHAXT_008994 [Thalassiosira profunda]
MSLPSLPADALISVLCRCPAADHPALWRTCRSVRAALDSDAYKSERALGWAEVETRLIPGSELYDRDHPDGPSDVSDAEDGEDLEEKRRRRREEDLREYYCALGSRDPDNYEVVDCKHEVKVDGVVAGEVSTVLVPRESGDGMFHEATDAHSDELHEVGWTLCDAYGQLKVKSIRDADFRRLWHPHLPSANEGGFLYVRSVRVDAAYRSGDCSEVVAGAIQGALMDLEDKWTLATAICDYNVYLTREEARLNRQLIDAEDNGETNGAGRSEEEERLRRRQKVCNLLDARTYLRVGFKQIPEVVGTERDAPVWLFALPNFWEEDMLTEAEAADIPLKMPPELPPEPQGVDQELRTLVANAGYSVRHSMDELKASEHTSAEYIRQLRIDYREKEEQLAGMSNLLEGARPEHIPLDAWESLPAKLPEYRNELDSLQTLRDEEVQRQRDSEPWLRRKQEEINEKKNATMVEARALVNERGASVRKSFALHSASRERIAEFFDSLLDLVPPRERELAIAELDCNGCSPLHCAVTGSPELFNKEEYIAFARRLLNSGADPDVRDINGRTALGRYRTSMSSRLDFCRVYDPCPEEGPLAWRAYHNQMEDILRPTRGETEADRDAMPSAYDDDADSWNMEVDDDDFEDEDGDVIDGNDEMDGANGL